MHRTTSSTIESVEAVRAPRALLPAMLCISVRAEHATDGPKSRKLHLGEFVKNTHVSPPNPRIKARFQRAASEPFGCSFPSFCQHRKGATGGRRMPNAARKSAQSKT